MNMRARGQNSYNFLRQCLIDGYEVLITYSFFCKVNCISKISLLYIKGYSFSLLKTNPRSFGSRQMGEKKALLSHNTTDWPLLAIIME